VVSLAIDYRQALRHGDLVRLESQVLPRRGVRLPWRTRFVTAGGVLAAEARVDLVLVDLGSGPTQRRLARQLPADLAEAVATLVRGPQ
jgi:acyl-CoA thioester hydrolase